MAKIRVYELARDLNKTNKELLETIKNMGLAVKSHMDPLDDESVAKIKAKILSYKNEMGAEETREKPTIFYKRKKRATKTLEALINRRKSCITQPDLTEAKKDLKEQRFTISNGEMGYSYENIFGEYLKGATHIFVEDPYIRFNIQIQNFVRFCELVVKIGDAKKIDLTTNYEDEIQKVEAKEKILLLGNCLKKYDIEFKHKFDPDLHDRQIILDNGWIIDIGRGLNIYKKAENWFSIGSYDFELRPCLKTNVHIFK